MISKVMANEIEKAQILKSKFRKLKKEILEL